MPFALNNVETQDAYADETTLECPGAVLLDIFVLNAAAYYSYAIRNPAQSRAITYRDEVLLPVGAYVRTRCAQAVRFRSAATGVPARVTVEAVLPDELRCAE